MKAIDETHPEPPFRGNRRIRDELIGRGIIVLISRKKVQRLMRQMGMVALYRKRTPVFLAKVIKSILTCRNA